MRGITFNVTVPSFLVGKALGRLTNAAVFGSLSGLRAREAPEADLPGRDWVRIEVVRAGICGTDLGTLSLKASPILEPFGSFPAVLGHEIVGKVVETGPATSRAAVGDRVVVDPMISCSVRGYAEEDLCPSCTAGFHSTCERAGEVGATLVGGAAMRPGTTIGYHASLPGGWSERVLAHDSQVFRVPESMDDDSAVMVEPLAVAMHAALRSRPFGSGPVLVIGSGPIALGAVWALRVAGYDGDLVAQVKRGHEAELARRLGASVTVAPGDEARSVLVDTGSNAYMPIMGPEVFAGGGFELVFDCVGSRDTLDQALRFASPRGRIVALGCTARMNRIDLTLLWAREIEVRGYVGYGLEDWKGDRVHTFDATLRAMAETTDAPFGEMVTHVLPLDRYREALSLAFDRRRSGAIKVAFDPRA